MRDLPYLMQDPVKDELWLVTSETRLLITTEIYDLLASNGAELPSAYGIEKLREQNAKLRELVKRYHRLVTGTDELWSWQSVYAELQELGIEVNE